MVATVSGVWIAEVPRLGRLEARPRRLRVAHLADHDDVRVLPHRGHQRVLEAVGVAADLALDDHAAPRLEQELDRILDRDDVRVPRVVDVADQHILECPTRKSQVENWF